MRRRSRLLPVFLPVLLALACSTGTNTPTPTFEFVSPGGQTTIQYPQPQRRPVAALSGPSLLDPGKTVALADYRGQVVLLNLWGAWCGPCRAEADTLTAVETAGRPRGIRVLGINVRDNAKYAADFVRDRAVSYESIFDPAGRTALQLRGLPLAAIPISLAVDKQQRVAAVWLGPVRQTEIQPVLDALRSE